MQETSALYKELQRLRHTVNIKLVVDGTTFYENSIMSMKTTRGVFSGSTPSVGNCVSGTIDVQMLKPSKEFTKQAKMVPYVQLTDGTRDSEWLKKGEYYIDTRMSTEGRTGVSKLTLHGYDAMMFAEEIYSSSNLDWPARDTDIVLDIAKSIGVQVDTSSLNFLDKAYSIGYPTNYSKREVLSNIAAMYAGNFIINDLGKLQFLPLNSIPKETRRLIDTEGNFITIGGVYINV